MSREGERSKRRRRKRKGGGSEGARVEGGGVRDGREESGGEREWRWEEGGGATCCTCVCTHVSYSHLRLTPCQAQTQPEIVAQHD